MKKGESFRRVILKVYYIFLLYTVEQQFKKILKINKLIFYLQVIDKNYYFQKIYIYGFNSFYCYYYYYLIILSIGLSVDSSFI